VKKIIAASDDYFEKIRKQTTHSKQGLRDCKVRFYEFYPIKEALENTGNNLQPSNKLGSRSTVIEIPVPKMVIPVE